MGFGATREFGQPGALQPGSRDATTFVATHRVHPAIGAILAAILNPHQRRRLLVADRSRDAGVAAVTEVLAANPDVEIAFGDASAQSYLIACERLSIVFGMQAMLAAVTAAGMTVKQNRAALAGTLLTTT